MIEFEREILDYLGLPSIPKKMFDGQPFKKGVAVINLVSGGKAYASCTYSPDKMEKPVINKVFSLEQYTGIDTIYIVPDYMATKSDIPEMDLDDESKKRAEELLSQAEELELDGVESEVQTPQNEYYFDNIKNDSEAKAFISAYNKRNRIRGRVPKTHEGLIMRLAVIYNEINK